MGYQTGRIGLVANKSRSQARIIMGASDENSDIESQEENRTE